MLGAMLGEPCVERSRDGGWERERTGAGSGRGRGLGAMLGEALQRWRPMLSRCIHAFDEYRARRIATFLSRFIDLDDRVLDCGCGQMIVARSVREGMAIEIWG